MDEAKFNSLTVSILQKPSLEAHNFIRATVSPFFYKNPLRSNLLRQFFGFQMDYSLLTYFLVL